MQYELLYLVGESNKPKLDKIKEEAQNTIKKEGGTFLEPQLIKERKMSYKVENDIRGIYVAQRFEVSERDSEKHNAGIISNVTKKFNLNQDILRFIIVKADELPELKERDEKERVMKPKTERREERLRPKAKIEYKKDKPKEEEKKDEKSDKKAQEDIDKKLEEILKI